MRQALKKTQLFSVKKGGEFHNRQMEKSLKDNNIKMFNI